MLTSSTRIARLQRRDYSQNNSNVSGAPSGNTNRRSTRQVSAGSSYPPGDDDNNNEVQLLDLRGYQERPAIRALADFLEQHKNNSNNTRNRNTHGTWVRIITGGSHSFGPVLRPAVQRLLERRQMTFMVDSPSSFCVDAASGISCFGSTRIARRRHHQPEPRLQVVSNSDLPTDGVIVVGRPISVIPPATTVATDTVLAEDVPPRNFSNSSSSHHSNNVRQVFSGSHSLEINDNNKNKMPLLDLHGFREGPAIRALADFLEENRYRRRSNSNNNNNNNGYWVRIITGTSHSFGPVLRPLVQRFLERHQMTFVVDTPSTFCVDASSGVTYFLSTRTTRRRHLQPEPRLHVGSNSDLPADDIIVVGRPSSVIPPAPTVAPDTVLAADNASTPRASRAHSTFLTGTGTTATRNARRSARNIVLSWWENCSERQTISNPEMEQVAQAREASLAEPASAASASAATLHNTALKEVLAISRKEYERRELADYKKGKMFVFDEDDDLRRALALSRNEYEEATLQHALTLSKEQEEDERQQEENLLQTVVQESQQEPGEYDARRELGRMQVSRSIKGIRTTNQRRRIEEEDEALEEAVQSLEETQRRERAEEEEEEEERMLQEVIWSLDNPSRHSSVAGSPA